MFFCWRRAVPFGVGPEADILARIAAGMIWVAALLAALLSLERLFQEDYEDGSLEQLTLSACRWKRPSSPRCWRTGWRPACR